MTTSVGVGVLRVLIYLRQELLSVFLPGVALAAELWLLARDEDPLSAVQAVSGATTNLSPLATLLVLLLAAAGTYAMGFVARALAFKSVAVVLDRWPLAYEIASLTRRPLSVDLREIILSLNSSFGTDFVQNTFARHPINSIVERYSDAAPGASLSGAGTVGRQSRSGAYRDLWTVFDYCKMWLRRSAPDLAVDIHEARINAHVALVLPSALVAAVFIRHGVLPWAALWAVIWVLAAIAFFVSGVELMAVEKRDALRNFVQAHAFEAVDPRSRAGDQPVGDGGMMETRT